MQKVDRAALPQQFATSKTLCQAYDIGMTKCRELIDGIRKDTGFHKELVVTQGRIWIRVKAFDEYFMMQDIRKICEVMKDEKKCLAIARH